MGSGINWSKIVLETFLEESGINDRIALGDEKARIQSGIIRTRIAGWTITKQAHEFHVSNETISQYIKEIKELYDATQLNSIILPKRVESKSEKELDK